MTIAAVSGVRQVSFLLQSPFTAAFPRKGSTVTLSDPISFTNRVAWAIEPERCALLLHDMQPHYLDAVAPAERERLVANARSLATAARERGVPVFASRVSAARERCERGLMLDMWGKGPAEDSGPLDPALGLAEADVRPLIKRSYSAFFGNDFEVSLRRLGRDSILVAGVYTSIGCHASAMDAFMRDIRAFVVADATGDLQAADHGAGLAAAARTCARVVHTETVCRALRRGRSGTAAERFDVC